MTREVLFAASAHALDAQLLSELAPRLLPPQLRVRISADRNSAPPKEVREALAELALSSEVPLESLATPAETELLVTLGEARRSSPLPPHTRHQAWPAHTEPVTLHMARVARDETITRLSQLACALAPEPAVGILGGSGFYELPGLTDLTEYVLQTPFGVPSAPVVVGRLAGRRVAFLARHGRGHALLPSEVNARANLYALKRVGVTHVISVSAVGSLRVEIRPGDVVLPRQFIDRTVARPSTFFGSGAVAHVSLADPVCGCLVDVLAAVGRRVGVNVHAHGTYVCIEGPQFSTRAEATLLRSWGADVVGMTNLPEARLAREAELCYATLTLPTDYDCWRTPSEEVRVTDVLGQLRRNVDMARQILAGALAVIDPARVCTCQRVLDSALVTPPETIQAAARVRLHALLARQL